MGGVAYVYLLQAKNFFVLVVLRRGRECAMLALRFGLEDQGLL